jgi:ankyrin repeat protein
LHDAAWSGNIEVAALLLGKGADINAKDKKGRSVLAVAAEGGTKKGIVGFLRERGAE